MSLRRFLWIFLVVESIFFATCYARADFTMLVAQYLANPITRFNAASGTRVALMTNSVSGDDSNAISICPAGGTISSGCDRGRGAVINLGGINSTIGAGRGIIDLIAGNNASGNIKMYTGNQALRFTIPSDGSAIAITTQFTSSATSDLGWSIQSAANQACNTTCTSACVFGQETTSKAILACTDATADTCLCAGAS